MSSVKPSSSGCHTFHRGTTTAEMAPKCLAQGFQFAKCLGLSNKQKLKTGVVSSVKQTS